MTHKSHKKGAERGSLMKAEQKLPLAKAMTKFTVHWQRAHSTINLSSWGLLTNIHIFTVHLNLSGDFKQVFISSTKKMPSGWSKIMLKCLQSTQPHLLNVWYQIIALETFNDRRLRAVISDVWEQTKILNGISHKKRLRGNEARFFQVLQQRRDQYSFNSHYQCS